MDQASFLTGANATYVSELYARYAEDPGSVDSRWAQFFGSLNDDGRAVLAELQGAPWNRHRNKVIGVAEEIDHKAAAKKPAPAGSNGKMPASAAGAEEIRRAALDSIRALMLIRSYRVRGHLQANLDPLALQPRQPHPELDYRSYGFTEADLDRPIFIDNVLGMETASLRTIVAALQKTYCATIGVEFMHIQDPEQKDWIQRRIEGGQNQTEFSDRAKLAIFERLSEAEGIEKFLQMKYTGTKRFGLEGGEALIPAIEQILKRGSQLGVREVVLGMAHRGRLNVLTNVMKKPYSALFSEFQGNPATPEDVQGSGDVKYHLGTSADRDFDGINVHLSLTANPSHLEIGNPVVLGKVRAKLTQRGDSTKDSVMALLIHGDAAFAGQGVVMECFAMSQLEGYTTGGTVHIVINNQIGFTTAPRYSRSGPYCTDVAKIVQAPILHVNGDDVEAVVHAARIAIEFRQQFKGDVVLDLVCYRRHGHNEGDEPAFTQPLMYRNIATHPTTRQIHAARLVAEGVLTEEQADKIAGDFQARLEADFQASKSYKVNKADWLEGKWSGLGAMSDEEEMLDESTDIDSDMLQRIGRGLTTVPADFNLNKKIARQLEAKQEMFRSGEGFDWSTAEAMAFGSLLVEGTPVRLSGQDSGRGTFSQRHSVLTDQETERRYIPLNNIKDGQAEYEVIDSLLSEEGVLGFEYGYSLAEPSALTLWEAQFGDFANGAQVLFDQFISSGESKWLRMSGLVMLLPHGMEGQGPEHSSARWERHLQMCAEDNMQVCNLTTPANYFHALRRQVRRNYRKPLIIMTPKSLLRHKLAVSPVADFAPGSRFRRVLPETEKLVADAKIKRVILCSGKVYYDLFEERAKREVKDVAIIRIEQLYPWPRETVTAQLKRYTQAEIIWCQEEPANMGPWMFVDRRLHYILEQIGHKTGLAHYVGRRSAAAPATGSHKAHVEQQAALVDQALAADLDQLPQPFARQTKLGSMVPPKKATA